MVGWVPSQPYCRVQWVTAIFLCLWMRYGQGSRDDAVKINSDKWHSPRRDMLLEPHSSFLEASANATEQVASIAVMEVDSKNGRTHAQKVAIREALKRVSGWLQAGFSLDPEHLCRAPRADVSAPEAHEELFECVKQVDQLKKAALKLGKESWDQNNEYVKEYVDTANQMAELSRLEPFEMAFASDQNHEYEKLEKRLFQVSKTIPALSTVHPYKSLEKNLDYLKWSAS